MLLGQWRSGVLCAGAFLCGFVGVARAGEAADMECYSTARTREEIIAHKLAEPFASMRAASRQTGGDPIGARLCRMGTELVYEVSLLHRDGRIVKVHIDAVSGNPHVPQKEHAP